MVKKKRQSKRTTLKDKYKIEKKVKEHRRKQRREERQKLRNGTLKKGKKSLGLPNLMPYKEKFIQQMMDDREREKAHELARLKRLNEMRKQHQEESEKDTDYDDDMALDGDSNNKKRKRASGPSADDLANAAERAKEFEDKNQAEDDSEDEDGVKDVLQKGKKRMYMKELRNVVETSDVVLLVVDARDPMGCRAPQVERMVLENAKDNHKRLVIIMNKIDLVPKPVVEKWLTELRKEFPTVAFRASTQEQKSNLGRASKDSIALGTSGKKSSIGDGVCVGADTLLQLLKNYSRNKDIKTSITVGVVGYPNVGKSSVINSLKRARAVGVSSTPGFTKTMQVVQLDKKVKLIDSPGVLFQDSNQTKDSTRLILRNCLSPLEIEDPVTPVLKLVEKCDPSKLMLLYNIPQFETAEQFIVEIARKRGKLKAGGVPDQIGASQLILQDWNAGKIPFYVQPPEPKKQTKIAKANKIVTEWSKEFDLDKLMQKNEDEMVEYIKEDDINQDPDDFAVVFNESVKL